MAVGKPVSIGGVSYPTQRDAAAVFGISSQLFGRRLSKGLTPEQAAGLEPFPDWFIPGKGQFARARAAERKRADQVAGCKQCARCKVLKPLDEFAKRILNTPRSGKYCSECVAQRWIEYRYKIPADQFFALVQQQNGQCAICRVDLPLSYGTAKGRRGTAIDHCHKTGFVRGILCSECNNGLGNFRDSIPAIKSAIKYLEQAEQSIRAVGAHGQGTKSLEPGTTPTSQPSPSLCYKPSKKPPDSLSRCGLPEPGL